MAGRILVDKPDGLYRKRIYVSDTANGPIVIKETAASDEFDYRVFQLMQQLGVAGSFARVRGVDRSGTLTLTTIDYVPYNIEQVLSQVTPDLVGPYWFELVRQLASLIDVLERHHVQHNDFNPSNVRLEWMPPAIPQIKVIDLETTVAYRIRGLRARGVVCAGAGERWRMGWSRRFHPGADLNQMLGELWRLGRRYHMPPCLASAIVERLVVEDKQFPFAIEGSNPATTGSAVLRMLEELRTDA